MQQLKWTVIAMITMIGSGCFVTESEGGTAKKTEFGQALGINPFYTSQSHWYLGPVKSVHVYIADCPNGLDGVCSKTRLEYFRKYGTHGGLTMAEYYFRNHTSDFTNRDSLVWSNDFRIQKRISQCLGSEQVCIRKDSLNIYEYHWANKDQFSVVSTSNQSKEVFSRKSENKWLYEKFKDEKLTLSSLNQFSDRGFWMSIQDQGYDTTGVVNFQGSMFFNFNVNQEGALTKVLGSNYQLNKLDWDGRVKTTIEYSKHDQYGNGQLVMQKFIVDEYDSLGQVIDSIENRSYQIREFTYW
jgi:hypothetical protein